MNGIHPGFRRNHAKGVCVTGYFDSNGKGTRISKAILFRPGRVPVIGRFSLGTGDPDTADGPGIARGLGIDFQMSDGEEWRTTMVNLPVFPFKTRRLLRQHDCVVPQTGNAQPVPRKMAAFMASHPEFLATIRMFKSHEPSSGFDDSHVITVLTAFLVTDARRQSDACAVELRPVSRLWRRTQPGGPIG